MSIVDNSLNQIVVTARVAKGVAGLTDTSGYEELQFVYGSVADLTQVRSELAAAIGAASAANVVFHPVVPNTFGPVTFTAGTPAQVLGTIECVGILADSFASHLA